MSEEAAVGRDGPTEGGRGEGGPGNDPEARLDQMRARILEVDEALVRLAGERLDLVLEIGKAKAEIGKPVLDPSREAAVVRRASERARELGIDQELVRDLIWRIIDAARQAQEGRSSWGPPPPSR